MKKIEDNWQKIYEVQSKLREKTEDPEADFEKTLLLPENNKQGESSGFVSALILPFHYRTKKKDGSFSAKTKQTGMVMKYCPFTGKQLYE